MGTTKEEIKRLLKEQQEQEQDQEEKPKGWFADSGKLHDKLNLLFSKIQTLHGYVRQGTIVELPDLYINGDKPQPMMFFNPELQNNEKIAKALDNLFQTIYDGLREDLAKLETEYKELNKLHK
jgi:hypothetical protein